MQSTLAQRAAPCLSTLLFCATAAANTLSDTYRAAYTEPDSFEAGYLGKASKDLYQNFFTCSVVAIPALNNLIERLRASHKACKDNSDCQQRAKEVRDAGYLRDKVQALDEYMKVKVSQSGAPYLKSQAGRWAKEMQASPIPYAKLPLFKSEMAMLASFVCK